MQNFWVPAVRKSVKRLVQESHFREMTPGVSECVNDWYTMFGPPEKFMDPLKFWARTFS